MVSSLLADVALRFLELAFALNRVFTALADASALLLPLMPTLEDNPETLVLRATFCNRDDLLLLLR